MLKLRLLTGPRAGRQLRVSDTKPVSVGRRVGRLRLHDSRVSKRHAKIFFAGGTWVLRDLGSANGTYVNQRKCDGLIELETGDMIQMGRVLIKVLQADAVGMDPMRTVPGTSGTQASNLGIDAFTASGATGQLPAIDPGEPIQTNDQEEGEIDLASIFGEDNTEDDDLIDFSDQSRADASRAGTLDAGKTQASQDTIELEPIDDPSDASQPTATTAGQPAPRGTDRDDPLLAGVASEPDPTDTEQSSDLVDLDDDVQPPTKLDTTMLAAIDGEDSQADADQGDDDADDLDDGKPPVVGLRLDQPAPEQPPAADERAKDAPAQLDDEHVEDVLVEPASAGLTPAKDSPAEQADAPAQPPTAVEQPVASDPSADADTPTPQVDSPPASITPHATDQAPRASDASLTDTPAVDDTAEPVLDLETAHAELVFDDIAEQAPPPIDPDILAQELWPTEIDDHAALESQAQPEAEPEVEAEPEHDAKAEDAPIESVAQDTDDQPVITDAIGERFDAQAPIDDVALIDEAGQAEQAEPIEQAEPVGDAEPAEAHADPLDPAGFDIDAAFDALSVGLDDSVQLPALTDEHDADEHDTDQATGDALEPSEPAKAQDSATQKERPADVPGTDQLGVDDLAGSQLDISFIRDALAKLGDEHDEPAEQSEQDNDALAKPGAQADHRPIAPPTESGTETVIAPEAAPEAEDPAETQSEPEQPSPSHQEQLAGLGVSGPVPILAPPGLNPTTVRPPSEPGRSSRSPSEQRKRRWFFTALSMLVVFGLGAAVAFLYATKDQPIAGRSDTPAPNTTPGTDPNTDEPGSAGNAPSPADRSNPNRNGPPDTPNNPYITPPFDGTAQPPTPAETGPTPPDTIAGTAPVPAPFSEGPPVLGRSALAGITVPNNASETPLPNPDPRLQPGVVIQPELPGPNLPNTPPGPSDPITNPIDNLDPVDPIDPAPNPAVPAVGADKDARIVFLVDASGSLVDSLPQMLVWLGEAVETVGDDERFTVIFFKAGKAIEPDPAGLQAPTREVMAKLERDWLDPDAAPVLPSGRSDPSKAIAQALSYNPTDLYLLSDESFARYAGDTTRDQAVKLVATALGEAKVKLHGVQFFYRDEGGVLETLSNRYNGTFEFVKEDVVPDADPIDLLEELDKGE